MALDQAVYFRFEALLCLDPDGFELEELREVLAEQIDDSETQTRANRSYLYKAISHYDRLRYRPRLAI